ncbi:hypothetical protein QCA50_019322 [Cerrena zonata]|uniref:Uncharacterized protein n=1 Tax=Cerrena zonata TaxID=2478898 RepID=A0AAW0FM32_9APHY
MAPKPKPQKTNMSDVTASSTTSTTSRSPRPSSDRPKKTQAARTSNNTSGQQIVEFGMAFVPRPRVGQEVSPGRGEQVDQEQDDDYRDNPDTLGNDSTTEFGIPFVHRAAGEAIPLSTLSIADTPLVASSDDSKVHRERTQSALELLKWAVQARALLRTMDEVEKNWGGLE